MKGSDKSDSNVGDESCSWLVQGEGKQAFICDNFKTEVNRFVISLFLLGFYTKHPQEIPPCSFWYSFWIENLEGSEKCERTLEKTATFLFQDYSLRIKNFTHENKLFGQKGAEDAIVG